MIGIYKGFPGMKCESLVWRKGTPIRVTPKAGEDYYNIPSGQLENFCGGCATTSVVMLEVYHEGISYI